MNPNSRQERLIEDYFRRMLPVALIKGTLRRPTGNNTRLVHYRGPMGIHLIVGTSYTKSGVSHISIRRGKEWSISFSCQPKPEIRSFLMPLTHTMASGEILKHEPTAPEALPFFKASSENLSIKRHHVGRGMSLPTYVNFAYWMVEFGELMFIETIINIEAAERDLTILLMEIS